MQGPKFQPELLVPQAWSGARVQIFNSLFQVISVTAIGQLTLSLFSCLLLDNSCWGQATHYLLIDPHLGGSGRVSGIS